MPDALYFTDDPAACKLLASDPFALLMGFAIDQQVPVQKAFAGPLALKQRVGTLDPTKLAKLDLERGVPREAGDPPLPGLDGRARARARRGRRRGVRRRRLADLERGGRHRRPEEAARRAARLRPDEGDGARLGARAAASASQPRSRSSRITPASGTSTRRRRSPTTRPRSARTRPSCAPPPLTSVSAPARAGRPRLRLTLDTRLPGFELPVAKVPVPSSLPGGAAVRVVRAVDVFGDRHLAPGNRDRISRRRDPRIPATVALLCSTVSRPDPLPRFWERCSSSSAASWSSSTAGSPGRRSVSSAA